MGDQIEQKQEQDLDFIVKNSGTVGAGKLVDILVRYITTLLLTKLLGANTLGLFVLGRSFVHVVATICQLGMGLGAVRQIAFFTVRNETLKIKQIGWISIIIPGIVGVLATLILFLSGDFISCSIFKKPDLSFPLKYLVFSLLPITVSLIYLSFLRGLRAIKKRVAVENYFLPLSNLFLIIFFYFLGFRLEGAIAAFFLSNLLTLAVLIVLNGNLLKLKINDLFSVEKETVIHFMKFSAPLMIVKILGQLKLSGDILFLGLLSTSANVGIFFIASRIAGIISIPWQAANMVVAPMVAGYYAEGDIQSIEYNFKNTTKMVFTAAMFSLGFLCLFSGELLLIFGSEFQTGTAVVLLLCIGQVVKTLVGHSGTMLAMIGKPILNVVTTAIAVLSMVVLNVLLIPRYGILGAGVSGLASLSVTSCFELYFLYRMLKIHPFRTDFIKPVAAALISGGIIRLLKEVVGGNLLTSIGLMALFVLLFFSALYLLKLSDDEKLLLKKIFTSK